MGVIDAIAEGYFAVARRPVVLAPVVLLDLLFWPGGRVTPAPFTDAFARLLERAQRQTPTGSDPAVAASIASLRSSGGDGDLLELLTLGQHPLLTQLDPARVARPWGTGVVDPGHWALVVLLAVAFGLLGLLWLSLTLTLLATLVRGEPFVARALASALLRCWLRLLGFGAIVAGGFLLLALPLLILSGVLILLNLDPAVLVTILLLPLLVVYIHLALAPEAIAVSEVGPFQAMRLSIRVVRRNFWPTLGLLAATLLLVTGFPRALGLLAREAVGVPLAIAGNGLIGLGMAAAAMFFYRERLAAAENAKEPAKLAARRTR